MSSRKLRAVCLVAAAYAVLVAALLSRKPLWMDEILQLLVSRQVTIGEVVAWAPREVAVPLGYVTQHVSISLTGYSVPAARLSAALFGAASVLAVGILAGRLGMGQPWLASLLFALLPMTLRYSTEARTYSQALFLSIVLTLLFTVLAERPGAAPAAAYAILLAATLYTHPFAALVAGAHLAWAALCRKWEVAALTGAALAAAAVAFAPWFLWARSQWTAAIPSGGSHFVFTAKTPLMLFRELAGAGYWGSGLLLILSVLGAARSGMDRVILTLLLLLIAASLAGGLVADAFLDYFIASRQFMWVLPAVAVLAASAVEKRDRAAVALAVLLAVVCGYASVKRFASVDENWETAARALAAEVDRGACLTVAPQDARRLYVYFVPRLASRTSDCHAVVAAVSPYATERERAELSGDLASQGYVVRRSARVGATSVAVWER